MARLAKPLRASDRARLRLREELQARNITQQDLAEALTEITGEVWSKGKVNHVLNGHVQLLVDDADAIAKVAKLYLTEVVRDRGLEFYAEMTPTELKILERIRRRPKVLQVVMMVCDLEPLPEPSPTVRKQRRRVGRPLNSDLTKDA